MTTSLALERHGAVVVVDLAGAVDRFAAGALRRALAPGRETAGGVVVDLTRAVFVDSTALGIIAAAAKRLRADGRRLVLVVTDRNLRRTLRITAIDLLCDVYDARADALAALGDAGSNGGARTPEP